MPEVIECIQMKYKIVEGHDLEFDDALNDKIAALNGLIYSSSALLSPIFGGVMYDNYGYKTTLNVCMIFMFSLSFIYFSFNCGFNIFSKQRKFDEKIK